MTQTFHLAIIPDGNRRWARQHGLKGYRKLYDFAIEGLVDVAETAFEQGVTHLSLWGSSHANLSDRSSSFFTGIDRAFRTNVHRFSEHPVLEKYDVRVSIIGEWRGSLTPKTIEAFDEAIAKTAHRKTRELTLLIDYSGTREREAAVRSILDDPSINVPADQLLRERSWTGHLPELDLIIRTGSWLDPHNSAGFMSLLADETQLSFPQLYWPDFKGTHLTEILDDFRSRERRHGK
jgi:undecaprenyl diphosphate synthase